MMGFPNGEPIMLWLTLFVQIFGCLGAGLLGVLFTVKHVDLGELLMGFFFNFCCGWLLVDVLRTLHMVLS